MSVSVEFHFNVPDRLNYTARLLRKAHSMGLRSAVVGEPGLLQRLSEQLWTVGQLDFISHCTDQADATMQQHSSILMGQENIRKEVDVWQILLEAFRKAAERKETAASARVSHAAARKRALAIKASNKNLGNALEAAMKSIRESGEMLAIFKQHGLTLTAP